MKILLILLSCLFFKLQADAPAGAFLIPDINYLITQLSAES